MKGGDMVEKSNLALSEGPGFENPHYYGTDIPYVEHHTGSRVSYVIYIFWECCFVHTKTKIKVIKTFENFFLNNRENIIENNIFHQFTILSNLF